MEVKKMLNPLKQWFCDKCGTLIKCPQHGYLEWYVDESGRDTGFKIVHNPDYSPYSSGYHCSFHFQKEKYAYDFNLTDCIGTDGLAMFSGYFFKLNLANREELNEIFRRLHLSYYEEARLYWSKAVEDGFFNGANEVWPYLQHTLQTIIRSYKK
jgi:hypothetical protein